MVLVGAAVALTGATCDKNGAEPGKPATPAATSAPTEKPAPASKPSPEAMATPVANGSIAAQILAELPEPAKREFSAVLSDEFCYCGCPHTLGQCLEEHKGCKHAPRMAVLAASHAADGVPSTEIIVNLSKYYLSFRDRVKMQPDQRMCLGPADAKVTMIEFSDFECPFCAAAVPLLKNFAKSNPNVRLCYGPFPLQSHPNALPAAQAVMFAREKGRFWELHDLLFENQMSLSREKIIELGGRVGLSMPELANAIDSGMYVDEIRRIKEAGKSAGVDSTPSVFINGRKLLLGLSTETLQHTVQDELEWQANDGAWAKD